MSSLNEPLKRIESIEQTPKNFAKEVDPVKERELEQLLFENLKDSFVSLKGSEMSLSRVEESDRKTPDLLDLFAVVGPDTSDLLGKKEEMDASFKKSFFFSPKVLNQVNFSHFSRNLPS
jgi:hypothetical protein